MADRMDPSIFQPNELVIIERVLKRLNGKIMLDETNQERRASIAMDLYRCGFTREDQLLRQLVHAINTAPSRRLANR